MSVHRTIAQTLAGTLPPTGTLRQPAELVAANLAPATEQAALEAVAERYAIAVTPHVASLINPDDPDDPIARQYIPSAKELDTLPAELPDPIGDHAHAPLEGIVHRYPDRVLFKLVHVCAVYCRFCFRREMVGPGKDNALSASAYTAALNYIRDHQEIWEVILTGGDPLMLSPRRLRDVMSELAAIPHVKIIRLHTRVPVADPDRITADLIDQLRIKGAATWVAVHVNHPRELNDVARDACVRLVDAGIPLVSQTVLLRGVNDTAEVMTALMRALIETRIKPYYLHHGDLAPGTRHLRTTIEEGQALMRALRGTISGLCQPDYVLDIPGGYGKAPIGPQFLAKETGTEAPNPDYRVEDFCGDVHSYCDHT